MLMNTRYFLGLALALASTAGLLAQAPTPLLTRAEPELLAVLRSADATLKDRMDACRELGVVGTRAAVPVLLEMLPDAEMSHMAIYAMETLPDPAVDTALRDALSELTGRQLTGVIISLGARRDGRAVGPLSGYLDDADPMVAQSAARALGSIGTSAASKALLQGLSSVDDANALSVHEGLLRCAEALSRDGRSRNALDIYQALRALPDADHQVRAGAVRGLIIEQPRQRGIQLLRESLSDPDYVVAAVAVRTSQELAGPDVTDALTADLAELSADRQIVVLQNLGERGDIRALPAMAAAAAYPEAVVRLEAVRAMAGMREPDVVPVLVQLIQGQDAPVADAARESLAALPFPGVDSAVMAMLGSTDNAQRSVGLELVGRRQMISALPVLMATAQDRNPQIRSAALRRVGELGGQPELPRLLEMLAKAETAGERGALEQALTGIATREDTPEPIARMVIGSFRGAQPAVQAVLLQVLGVVGGPTALKTVVQAATNENPEVRGAALRTLSTWKSEDAAPELLALARSVSDPTERMLCLRGYLSWVRSTDLALERRLAMAREVAPLIGTDEEKRLFLGAAGSIRSADALPMVVPHLDNAATRDEAAAAVLTIAEPLLKGPTERAASVTLRDALQKAVDAAPGGDLADRLRKLLPEANSRAGGA